jgi:hypothetical protein
MLSTAILLSAPSGNETRDFPVLRPVSFGYLAAPTSGTGDVEDEMSSAGFFGGIGVGPHAKEFIPFLLHSKQLHDLLSTISLYQEPDWVRSLRVRPCRQWRSSACIVVRSAADGTQNEGIKALVDDFAARPAGR